MHVRVGRPGRCTGCLMCALACSLHREGGYNPRCSAVQPVREITGLVRRHEFPAGCDGAVADCCAGRKPPPCVEACFFGVLNVES
jgi:Fe-S-cluster-containing dehydrogenase component